MLQVAEIQEEMSILEPSAGMGHIADRIREIGLEPDVIEICAERRELLNAKGYNVVAHDFLEITIKDTPDGRGYDRIIMNPPFSNRRDALHIQHAYDLLSPGGKVVAIVGEGVYFGKDSKAEQFREWIEGLNGTSEKLNEGTFLDPSLPVNTGVSARMVVIEKPELEIEINIANKEFPKYGAQYDKSLQTAEDITKSQIGNYHFPLRKRDYLGKILGVTDLHVVQSLGKEAVIFHKSDLDRIPEVGENILIHYDNGIGQVEPPAQQYSKYLGC